MTPPAIARRLLHPNNGSPVATSPKTDATAVGLGSTGRADSADAGSKPPMNWVGL